MRTREHWYVLAASGAVALGLAVAAFFLEPDARGVGTHEQLGLPPCMTMELWNLPCPGCGVTTAVTLASHGSLLDALATQPFGFALWLAALGFLAWSLVGCVAGRDLGVAWRRLPAARLAGGAAALAVAAWIYKILAVR